MREAPTHVTDAEVLAVVSATWDADVDAVEHLPVGFGAHHWKASAGGVPRLFVTLDGLGLRHDLASLEATYAAAAALGLDFVHGGLAPWVVPLAGGALSVTPWLDGARPSTLDVAATTSMLQALHAVPPPDGLRRWVPLVGADLADRLADDVRRPWEAGPLGEAARTAIDTKLVTIGTWVASYHRAAALATNRPWVATHGQPAIHNQLMTRAGLRLVDWESLVLAPAERDLRTVGTGDEAMVEMFALEWCLDEIVIGATRLRAPHAGTADDHETLANLLEELGH